MALPRDLAASTGVAVFDIVDRTSSQVRFTSKSAGAGGLAEVHEVVFEDDNSAVAALLRGEIERGRLPARGYHRIRRVARTLSDLAGAVDAVVAEDFVAMAFGMRARVGASAVVQAAS